MSEGLRPGDRLSGLMRAARGLAVAIADADGRLVEWSDGARLTRPLVRWFWRRQMLAFRRWLQVAD